ncbi:MAG: response regulator [Cytophagales bacterium]|nr:MAG: response regulator [Cytophagales bacterium]
MNPNATQLVLLADDDEDDQLMLESLFRQICPDYLFATVPDGQALIERLEWSNEPPPSLILLDLNMPLVGGFDVLRHLKASERLYTIPVIVLTTSSEERDVRQSYALGANAFLTKPGSHADLKAMVEVLRDFWLRQARLPAGGTLTSH